MAPKKKKIPTKSELVQLQRLYKTDEKIGERLGGVPAYLVAYWRRKKNVPKHSQPKFSEKEILNLWERFGDDDKCGMELGISKAAFYNWRRRYNIKEKPAFLKLEQLELNFPGLKLNSGSISLYNKQTITQKIISEKLDADKVEIGESFEIEPDIVLSKGHAAELLQQFNASNTDLVWNPNKIIVSLTVAKENDQQHDPEADKQLRDFVKRQGIKNFYESTVGFGQQVAIEHGQILPGQIILSSDNYASSLGAVAASAQSVPLSTIAESWSTGKTTVTIPETIRVDLHGRRSRGVYCKDIALAAIQKLRTVDVKNKAIEYYGNVISQMTISERFTLCNLSRDIGAVSAICSFDSVTRRYLTGRTQAQFMPVIADKNAEYADLYQINIDKLPPQISNGNNESIKPAAEYENLAVQVIIIGTESNGRFDDLRVAAEILKGKHVSPDCRLYIYPSSRSVYIEALKKGLIRVLVESGATIVFPGAHNIFETGSPFLAKGERALVTSNYSLIGSLDAEKSDVFICSPATAAAAAINGTITDPSRFVK